MPILRDVVIPTTAKIVDICGRRSRDYLLDCLIKLNREKAPSELVLRGIGSNISKGVGLAQVLVREFACTIGDITVRPIRIHGQDSSSLEIVIKRPALPAGGGASSDGFRLVDDRLCPPEAYSLLIDSVLVECGALTVSALISEDSLKEAKAGPTAHAGTTASNRLVDDSEESEERVRRPTKLVTHGLVSIVHSATGFDVAFIGHVNGRARWGVGEDLRDAYYRAGLLRSPDWERVAHAISRYDDVLICADTNILRNAVVTTQLLGSFSLVDPREHVHLPNWILIVVPNAVVHELEQVANARDFKGKLKRDGRMGYRALQELLEINNSTDLAGVSLAIVGTANPILDARVELLGLRQDMAMTSGKRSPKSSSGDMIIRSQFKEFLRQIDFHKGVFFLTGDKSNAALARAEALHPLYYGPPPVSAVFEKVSSPTVACESSSGHVTWNVSAGKLVYELAVQYGSIELSWGEPLKRCTFSVDRGGESLDPWAHRYLKLSSKEPLLASYQGRDRLSLRHVSDVWQRFEASLEATL